MSNLFLRHKVTKKRYRIIGMDKAKNEITLQGELATFTQPYDKDELQRLGYVMEKEAAAPADEDEDG